MHGIDSLVEVFSAQYDIQKGAMGLFFEINQLLGIVLMGLTIYFVHFIESPKGIKHKD